MKKGEIWLVELPAVNGHEQIGLRPAIIISDTKLNISIIVPITSNLQALKFPQTIEIKPSNKTGLTVISIALIFQIRAIDKKRLKNKIGFLEDSTIKKLDNILKEMLEL